MRTRKTRPGLKRLMAIALVIAMLLTVMPASVSAKPGPKTGGSPSSPFAWLFQSLYSKPAAEPAPEAPAAEPEAPTEEPVEEPEPEEPAEEPAPEPEAPAEEPAPEAPAAEPAAFAAELNVDDLTVSIEAEAGAFPEGTAVTAEKADLAGVQKAVDDAEDVSGQVLYAVDITFTNDGQELQPAEGKTVKVSFSAPELKAAEEAAVVHIDSETQEAEKVDTVEAEEADVAFEAEKFSVYAVIDPENGEMDEPRLKITFKMRGETEDTEIDSVYLKKTDAALYKTENDDGMVEKIVYDPGVIQENNMLFMGWTTERNYDAETAHKDIAGVRDEVVEMVNNGVAEGEEIVYYAMMLNCFRIFYEDEDGITVKTQEVLTDEVTGSARVDCSITPENPNQGLVGWKIDGAGDLYVNGDTINNITGDLTLKPEIRDGIWIRFDENDGGTGVGGASYTPPVFVENGAVNQSHRPEDPTRRGYEFDGWYTGAPAEDGQDPTGNVFQFSETLLEDTRLYAKWTAKEEASYIIIVWAQEVTNAWNAADEDKTYNYVETEIVEGVAPGTVITEDVIEPYRNLDNAYFGATDLANGSTAFHYRDFYVENGENGVSASGDTIVNIRYDRNVFKVEFRRENNANWSGAETTTVYSPVDEVSGSAAYGLVNGQFVELDAEYEKYIVWTTNRNGSLLSSFYLGELDSVAIKPNNSNTTVNTAQIDLTNAVPGEVYNRLSGSSTYTLGKETNSLSTIYKSSSDSTRIYAVIKTRNPHYEYNGEPYTGQLYRADTFSGTAFVGLYGQSFEQLGYEWPWPEGRWANIAFLDSFNSSLFGNSDLGPYHYSGSTIVSDHIRVPNTIITYTLADEPNTQLYFYGQDAEDETVYTLLGSSGYNLNDDQGFRITQRFFGEEPSGYAWTTSSAQPSTWKSAEYISGSTTDGVNADGITNEKRGSNTALHIKYDRIQHKIDFKYGGETVKTVDDIPYGRNISRYEDETPILDESDTIPAGYYFAGWFEDEEGRIPVDWDRLMPDANLVFYGVLAPQEYHVVVEPNGGDYPESRKHFWVPYEEVLTEAEFMITKTESGKNYTLVGWYTDPDRTNLWDFETRIVEQTASYMYDGPNDPRRLDFPEGKQDYAEDSFGNNIYANTVGVLTLYARWRDEAISDAGGVKVRYVFENSTGGTTVVPDQRSYSDQGMVIAGPSPLASSLPEDKVFRCWKVGNVEVYPSNTFYADSALAETGVEGFEPDDLVITVVAQLVDKESKTDTFVDWYSNVQDASGVALTASDFTCTKPANVDNDVAEFVEGRGWKYIKENLFINENYAIIPAATFTYPGYDFKGWAKKPDDTVDNLFLKWEPTRDGEGVYKAQDSNGDWVEVEYVGADELLNPETNDLDHLYAVWEKAGTFNVVYSSAPNDVYTLACKDYARGIDLVSGVTGVDENDQPVTILPGVHDGFLYAGYYTAAPVNGKWDVASAGTADGRTLAPQPNTTYYVKEVDASYLSGYCTYSYVGTANAYKNQCTSMVFLSSIDDLNYSGVGFVLNKDDQLTNKTSGVRKSIKFKPAGKDAVTINASSAFGHAGYLTYLDVGTILDFASLISESTDENDELAVTFSSANFQLYPYWVTLDGVPVVGTGSDVVIHVLEDGVVIKPANRANITDGVPANVMAVLEPAGN